MTDLQVTFSLDTSLIAPACFELVASLLAEARDRSPQLCHRIVDLIDAGAQLFRIEPDVDAAAGAGRMLAKPSDGLLVLMSALRAGKLDLVIIEQALGHGVCSSSEKAASITPSPSAESEEVES
jgi:hypothetical protein